MDDSKQAAVKAAIQAVMDAVQGADAKDMMSQRSPAMAGDGDGDEAPDVDCEACQAGTCDDPEHMKPDDLAAMLSHGQDAG